MIPADLARPPLSPVLDMDFLADPVSLEAAFWTIVIETPLFFLAGFRRASDCLWFALVNFISNRLLNSALAAVTASPNYLVWVLVGECLVVALEFTLCRQFLPDAPGPRLLRVLLMTNAASFLAGLLFFEL